MNNLGISIIENLTRFLKYMLNGIAEVLRDGIEIIIELFPFLLFLGSVIFGILSITFVCFYISWNSSDYIIKAKPIKEDSTKEVIYNADYYINIDHGSFIKIILKDSKEVTLNTNGYSIEITPVPEGSLNDAK